MQHFEYFEELRRQGREQEEAEGDLYEIEEFICKQNGSVLILWENWNEPTWVSVNRVSHLRMYQEWRESEDYVELSESESEEDSEENDESVENIEIAIEELGSESD